MNAFSVFPGVTFSQHRPSKNATTVFYYMPAAKRSETVNGRSAQLATLTEINAYE